MEEKQVINTLLNTLMVSKIILWTKLVDFLTQFYPYHILPFETHILDIYLLSQFIYELSYI
jgi:hypothetical protein